MEAISRFEPDEEQITHNVWVERARVCNDRLVAGALLSPLGIVLAAWLQSMAVGWKQALTWAALMAAAEAVVIFTGYYFKHNAQAQEDPTNWVRAMIACSGLLGFVWGLAVWFVWSGRDFLYYITILCVLVGVSNISMVIMSPVRRAMAAFSVAILLPTLVHLAVTDNPIALEIGVGLIVMLVVQVRYATQLRDELIRQIDSSVRNVALLGLLSHASRELAHVYSEMESKNAELKDAMGQLNQLVTFDQLTGCYSRRFILEELERQVSVSHRHDTPVTLIMFDLDHFKSINDTYGHAIGDRALLTAATAAQDQLRDGDMLARIGGEEFLIVLPMTQRDAAALLAERLRLTLASTRVDSGNGEIVLPASFGVAELQAHEDFSAWFRRVDAALYQAKASGRNTLMLAD